MVAFEIDARRIAGRTLTLEPVLQGQAMPCCQNTHFRSPQAKKAAFEKAGTLNARGVAEALRRDLGKVVPELRRIQTVNERTAADRAGTLGVCLRHYRPSAAALRSRRFRNQPKGGRGSVRDHGCDKLGSPRNPGDAGKRHAGRQAEWPDRRLYSQRGAGMVLIPFPDRHIDHRVIFDACVVACRPSHPAAPTVVLGRLYASCLSRQRQGSSGKH